MTTETAGAPPVAIRGASYGFDWYVHKHRHEHEANSWDERRLRVAEAPEAPIIARHLLIKFLSCVIGLTVALGIVVTAIR